MHGPYWNTLGFCFNAKPQQNVTKAINFRHLCMNPIKMSLVFTSKGHRGHKFLSFMDAPFLHNLGLFASMQSCTKRSVRPWIFVIKVTHSLMQTHKRPHTHHTIMQMTFLISFGEDVQYIELWGYQTQCAGAILNLDQKFRSSNCLF